MFGKLLNSECKKFGCTKILLESRDEICCFEEVEGKNRVNTIEKIIWRKSRGLSDSDSVSEECMMNIIWLFQNISITCFDYSFSDSKMCYYSRSEHIYAVPMMTGPALKGQG